MTGCARVEMELVLERGGLFGKRDQSGPVRRQDLDRQPAKLLPPLAGRLV